MNIEAAGRDNPDNRRYVLLKGAPQLTRQQMLDHWRVPHANLIIKLPEFWRYTSRYLQNHVIEAGPSVGNMDFDGVVETWQRKRTNPYSLFADEDVYKTIVRADERLFLNMSESVAMLTEVTIVVDGPEAGVKLLSFMRRRPEVSHEQFARHFLGGYAELMRNSASFHTGLLRYVQCVCIPQMERGFDGEEPTYGIDAVSELRFVSREAMHAAIASEEYKTQVQPEERKIFLSRTDVWVKEIEVYNPAAVTARP